jgi:hypothetical protein
MAPRLASKSTLFFTFQNPFSLPNWNWAVRSAKPMAARFMAVSELVVSVPGYLRLWGMSGFSFELPVRMKGHLNA